MARIPKHRYNETPSQHFDLGKQPPWSLMVPLGITIPHFAKCVEVFLNRSHPQIMAVIQNELMTDPDIALAVDALPPTSKRDWNLRLRLVSSAMRHDLFSPGHFDLGEAPPTGSEKPPSAGDMGGDVDPWERDSDGDDRF